PLLDLVEAFVKVRIAELHQDLAATVSAGFQMGAKISLKKPGALFVGFDSIAGEIFSINLSTLHQLVQQRVGGTRGIASQDFGCMAELGIRRSQEKRLRRIASLLRLRRSLLFFLFEALQ